MIVEIENKCPRCGSAVLVSPMFASGNTSIPSLALGYQCLPCDWFVIQPESSRMPAATFLVAATDTLRQDQP